MFALIMSVFLLFGLTAWGSKQQVADSGTAEPSLESAEVKVSEHEKMEKSAETSSGNETETASGAGENISSAENTESLGSAGGKTLVVYYSASGNTKEVAGYIAAATGGDLFELEPAEPYTDADLDWTDEDSRVCREHENEGERNVELVSATVSDWDSYETVFIGYPIWWHTAPMTVGTFLESYDFSGKYIYPVSQSASMDTSQYAQSVGFIKECAKGAVVDDGIFTKDNLAIRSYIADTVM